MKASRNHETTLSLRRLPGAATPSTVAGVTLVEFLVAMGVTVVLTAGSLLALRGLKGTDASFSRFADTHMKLVELEIQLRADLSRSVRTPNLEPFREILEGPGFPPGNTQGVLRFRQQRIEENYDGFFNRRWDVFRPVDDLRTLSVRHQVRFFSRTYLPGTRIDESRGLPFPDPRTPFNEAVVEGINQPYGPVYDYFGGILNNGMRDVLYFPSRISVSGAVQNASVAYRLVERSDRFNADLGSDGVPSEFEPGYHPRYRRDPSRDDVGNNRRILEGDGKLSGFEGRSGGTVDNRPPRFELQRLVYSMEPDPVREILVPRVRTQVLATDVVQFNVLYYDRAQKRYVEPDHLVARFGYPLDFGAAVIAVGPRTFRYIEPSNQTFLSAARPEDHPRHIFLYQLNLDWEEGDNPDTLYTVEPRIYTIDTLTNGGLEFTVRENIAARFDDPIRSVAGAGSVGYIDASGILRSRAVRDGFVNLKPNDRIFLEQRPLIGQQFGVVVGTLDPVTQSDGNTYSIRPGMYRVIEKRSDGVQIALQGQTALAGVPVLFRAPFFPPAIKLELTVGTDPLKYNVTVPIVLRMPQE